MRLIILMVSSILMMECSQKNNESTEGKALVMSVNKCKELADSSYGINDYKNAIKYFTKVIEFDSLNGESFYKRGVSLAKLHEIDSSSKDFLEAVKFGYRTADAYFMLGINQLPTDNDSLAVYYLKKSLKFNPNSQVTINALEVFEKRLKISIDKRLKDSIEKKTSI